MEDKRTGISIRFVQLYNADADRLPTQADIELFQRLLRLKQAQIELEELERMWHA